MSRVTYLSIHLAKNYSSLKKEVIFLSWFHGGSKVLDPVIQHHILQKRRLNYIFNSISYPSFVYQFALNHILPFLKLSHCPVVPFYFPEYRKSRVCDNKLSIWHAIFDSFDVLHTDSPLRFLSFRWLL